MSATAALEKQAIKELKYKYCYALDAGDVEGFVDLFVEDGVFEISHTESKVEGHEALRELAERISNFETTCLAHFALNPVIEVNDDGATGKWFNIIVLESADGRVEWGHSVYDDVYRQTSDDWKFEKTVVTRRHTLDLSGLTTDPGAASPLGSLR